MTINHITAVSGIVFITGLIMIIVGAAQGSASGGIFFVVPFVVVSGPLAGVGVLLIFLSFVLFQFGLFERGVEGITGTEIIGEQTGFIPERAVEPEPVKRSIRGGGIIFIGPIPIVFGDSGSMRYLLPIAILILILMVIAGFLM